MPYLDANVLFITRQLARPHRSGRPRLRRAPATPSSSSYFLQPSGLSLDFHLAGHWDVRKCGWCCGEYSASWIYPFFHPVAPNYPSASKSSGRGVSPIPISPGLRPSGRRTSVSMAVDILQSIPMSLVVPVSGKGGPSFQGLVPQCSAAFIYLSWTALVLGTGGTIRSRRLFLFSAASYDDGPTTRCGPGCPVDGLDGGCPDMHVQPAH